MEIPLTILGLYLFLMVLFMGWWDRDHGGLAVPMALIWPVTVLFRVGLFIRRMR